MLGRRQTRRTPGAPGGEDFFFKKSSCLSFVVVVAVNKSYILKASEQSLKLEGKTFQMKMAGTTLSITGPNLTIRHLFR